MNTVGNTTENGQLEIYVLREQDRIKPRGDLEALIRASNHPGVKVASFVEGRGISVINKKGYNGWCAHLESELRKMRASQEVTPVERLLLLYFLSQMPESII